MAATKEDKSEKKRKKQERAKARRQAKYREQALVNLYKPIEEWDDEELARGRPRAADGSFRGKAPTWVSRQLHEEAVRRFKDVASSDMRALVPTALKTIEFLLTSDGTDDNGKPLVPPSVRLEAAKWTVEHLVGKPTQRQEIDISVRLQSILGNAMVTPGEDGTMMPSVIDAESWESEETQET